MGIYVTPKKFMKYFKEGCFLIIAILALSIYNFFGNVVLG
jgi:hypothetical protein